MNSRIFHHQLGHSHAHDVADVVRACLFRSSSILLAIYKVNCARYVRVTKLWSRNKLVENFMGEFITNMLMPSLCAWLILAFYVSIIHLIFLSKSEYVGSASLTLGVFSVSLAFNIKYDYCPAR